MTWNISILSVTGPFGCQNISVISLGSPCWLLLCIFISFPYIIMPGVGSSSSSFTYSSLRVTLLPPSFLSFLLFPLLPPSFLSFLLHSSLSSFITFLPPSFLSFLLHSSPSSFIPLYPPLFLSFLIHSPSSSCSPLLSPAFRSFFLHSFL
jgi:hypothetical protein